MTSPVDPTSPPSNALQPAVHSRQPRRRWLTVLLAGVIFAAGLVVGAGATVAIAVHRIQHFIRHPDEAPERIARDLRRKLHLTEAQAANVGAILKKHQQTLQGLRRRIEPELESVFAAVERDIRAELDAQQRQRWQEMVRNFREHWLPPPVGPDEAGPANPPSP